MATKIPWFQDQINSINDNYDRTIQDSYKMVLQNAESIIQEKFLEICWKIWNAWSDITDDVSSILEMDDRNKQRKIAERKLKIEKEAWRLDRYNTIFQTCINGQMRQIKNYWDIQNDFEDDTNKKLWEVLKLVEEKQKQMFLLISKFED